jgi:hypothetical protein
MKQIHGKESGGGRGIRTPDTLSGIAVFKTACFNRSHIPPTAYKRRVINQFTTGGCCTDSQFVAQLLHSWRSNIFMAAKLRASTALCLM